MITSKKLFVFSCLVLLCLLFSVDQAFSLDTVKLYNGTILTGEIIEDDEEFILLKMKENRFTLFKTDIEKIYREFNADMVLMATIGQEPLSDDNDLSPLVGQYFKSIQLFYKTKNQTALLPYITESLLFAKHELSDRLFINDIPQWIVYVKPGDVKLVSSIIDEKNAVLIAEGTIDAHLADKETPIPYELTEKEKSYLEEPVNFKKRFLLTVFMEKEELLWKMVRVRTDIYKDPRYTSHIIKEIDYISAGYQMQCNRSSDVSECMAPLADNDYLKLVCHECMAMKNLDISACDNISKIVESENKRMQKIGYFKLRVEICKSRIAFLTGNPDICGTLIDQDKYGYNPQKDCYKSLEGFNYLTDKNLYQLDSDNDYLTNVQELYFNTSVASKDTDGDGKSDYEEVQAMTNPLGEGKLGDHLLK